MQLSTYYYQFSYHGVDSAWFAHISLPNLNRNKLKIYKYFTASHFICKCIKKWKTKLQYECYSDYQSVTALGKMVMIPWATWLVCKLVNCRFRGLLAADLAPPMLTIDRSWLGVMDHSSKYWYSGIQPTTSLRWVRIMLSFTDNIDPEKY